MGLSTDIDMAGNVLVVKAIKTGATIQGALSTTSQTTAGGSALTVSRVSHLGKTILLDTATGTTITLPAATGTGDSYNFLVSVTVSSNNHIVKVANATDTMIGVVALVAASTALAGDVAGGTDDTITMNGTTTGGIAGTYLTLTDVVSGKWYITGIIASSGTSATGGFSATV